MSGSWKEFITFEKKREGVKIVILENERERELISLIVVKL